MQRKSSKKLVVWLNSNNHSFSFELKNHLERGGFLLSKPIILPVLHQKNEVLPTNSSHQNYIGRAKKYYRMLLWTIFCRNEIIRPSLALTRWCKLKKITLVIKGEARLVVPNMASVPSSTFEISAVAEGDATLTVNGHPVEVDSEFLNKVISLLTTNK